MLAPVRIAAPVAPVVSLAAVKQHLRVDFEDDNTVLEALRDAAIDHLDGWSGILGRALVNQTWRQDFDRFSSCDPMRLPLVPVTAAPTVTYYDDDNVQQTLADSYWQVLTDELGPFIALKPGQSWPSSYSRADAVSIDFVAGYGAADTDVPVALQVAVMTHVKMNYDPASRETLEPMFKALVGPYIRFKL
jgi:uncharacterized phiE125 gp8 family phage protein